MTTGLSSEREKVSSGTDATRVAQIVLQRVRVLARGTHAAQIARAQPLRQPVAERRAARDDGGGARVHAGDTRAAGDDRRAEELAHERVERVVAGHEGLHNPVELLALRTRSAVGPVAELVRPRRGEQRMLAERVGHVDDPIASFHDTAEYEVGFLAGARLIELLSVVVGERRARVLHHRVERLVTAVAGRGRIRVPPR